MKYKFTNSLPTLGNIIDLWLKRRCNLKYTSKKYIFFYHVTIPQKDSSVKCKYVYVQSRIRGRYNSQNFQYVYWHPNHHKTIRMTTLPKLNPSQLLCMYVVKNELISAILISNTRCFRIIQKIYCKGRDM